MGEVWCHKWDFEGYASISFLGVMLPKILTKIPTTCRNFVLLCKETKRLGCRMQNVRVLDAKSCYLWGWKRRRLFISGSQAVANNLIQFWMWQFCSQFLFPKHWNTEQEFQIIRMLQLHIGLLRFFGTYARVFENRITGIFQYVCRYEFVWELNYCEFPNFGSAYHFCRSSLFSLFETTVFNPMTMNILVYETISF